MSFGPDCEFHSLTQCARHYRGRVFDEWAYCQTIRKRTEVKHCKGLAARLALPEPVIDSPGAALSVRHEWETRVTTLADEAMADFLVRVQNLAAEALSSSVLLAAGPFSRASVRSLWNRLTRRHEILDELPADDFTEAAYAEAAEVLQAPSPSKAATGRALSTALAYEVDEPAEDVPGRTRPSWQDRTARAARSYATREYNEHASDEILAQGYPRKRWVSRRDDRTRDSHRHADGQTVPVYDSFRVGASLLAFPGDETGPPGEVYNCRCVVVGVS